MAGLLRIVLNSLIKDSNYEIKSASPEFEDIGRSIYEYLTAHPERSNQVGIGNCRAELGYDPNGAVIGVHNFDNCGESTLLHVSYSR